MRLGRFVDSSVFRTDECSDFNDSLRCLEADHQRDFFNAGLVQLDYDLFFLMRYEEQLHQPMAGAVYDAAYQIPVRLSAYV